MREGLVYREHISSTNKTLQKEQIPLEKYLYNNPTCTINHGIYND